VSNLLLWHVPKVWGVGGGGVREAGKAWQGGTFPVLPDPRKPSRPILPKTTAGLGPFTAGKIFLHCRFHGRFYLQFFYEKKHIYP
jgi:hypothetical protein